MTLPDISYTEPTYELHDEDWYPGTIQTIETADGMFGPQLKWIITIDGELNDDGTSKETWAYCSQKLSPRSKLYAWAGGILGKGNVPETLNPSIFVGTPVDIFFERYMGETNEGTSIEKEKVTKIRTRKGTVTTTGITPGTTTVVPSATPIAAAREQLAPDEMPF